MDKLHSGEEFLSPPNLPKLEEQVALINGGLHNIGMVCAGDLLLEGIKVKIINQKQVTTHVTLLIHSLLTI